MVKLNLSMVLIDHRESCCIFCEEEVGLDNTGCNPHVRFCFDIMCGEIELDDIEVDTCEKHAHKIRKDWRQFIK